MLRIKICGMTNRDDALLACDLGADAVGFILYEKSPRHITPEAAAAIARQLPAHVARIGVFVDTAPDQIRAYLREIPLTAAQLHGDYTSADFEGFAPEQVLAVARVGEAFDVAELRRFEGQAAAILLDTQKTGLYGGTGQTFDWRVANAAAAYGRIVLAGGLKADNVARAVDIAQPYALDISSGVEARPGQKDPDKLRQLFQQLTCYRHDWKPGQEPAFPLT
jgi:phosphoribosylanthranilate isomerase